jgi:hypothetical protein
MKIRRKTVHLSLEYESEAEEYYAVMNESPGLQAEMLRKLLEVPRIKSVQITHIA